jgi:hypothetical protein
LRPTDSGPQRRPPYGSHDHGVTSVFLAVDPTSRLISWEAKPGICLPACAIPKLVAWPPTSTRSHPTLPCNEVSRSDSRRGRLNGDKIFTGGVSELARTGMIREHGVYLPDAVLWVQTHDGTAVLPVNRCPCSPIFRNQKYAGAIQPNDLSSMSDLISIRLRIGPDDLPTSRHRVHPSRLL